MHKIALRTHISANDNCTFPDGINKHKSEMSFWGHFFADKVFDFSFHFGLVAEHFLHICSFLYKVVEGVYNHQSDQSQINTTDPKMVIHMIRVALMAVTVAATTTLEKSSSDDRAGKGIRPIFCHY